MDKDGIIAIASFLIICVIAVIYLAPAISDLNTTFKAKKIIDESKNKEPTESFKEIGDLTVETMESELKSLLLAPVIGLILSGLFLLYGYLNKKQ